MRCVRNFLRINIVGQDEISNLKGASIAAPAQAENQSDPRYLLQQVMADKGVGLEAIKRKMVKEKFPKAESFETISDIPKNKIFELIERLKKI